MGRIVLNDGIETEHTTCIRGSSNENVNGLNGLFAQFRKQAPKTQPFECLGRKYGMNSNEL